MKNKMNTIGLIMCLAVSSAVGVIATGCAGTRYERSTGEYIDDKGLSARVKSALGDNAEYKMSDVNVTSFRGTVQLSGFVNSADQKRKAGDIARGVQGVKEVENNITVKESK